MYFTVYLNKDNDDDDSVPEEPGLKGIPRNIGWGCHAAHCPKT